MSFDRLMWKYQCIFGNFSCQESDPDFRVTEKDKLMFLLWKG